MHHVFRLGAFIGVLFIIVACGALGPAKPTVIISSPASGSQYQTGQDVAVQSTSSDAGGIVRVELLVDGATAKLDPSPTGSPQAQFTVIQVWKATGGGQHTLIVRATNDKGVVGEAAVTITVLGDTSAPNPTATNTPVSLPNVATAPPLIATATNVPANSPTPTLTPVPGACTNNYQFIADVTIPDGQTVAAGASFVKTWRVKNSGTCTWDSAYTIVFVGGEQMGAPSPALIPQAAAGATIDISLPMVAPAGAGTHTSSWRLRSSNGSQFSSNLTVVINVPGAPSTGSTATPTATAVAGCTGTPNISSFTASATTIIKGNSTTLSWGSVTNASTVDIDGEGVATPGSASVSPDATKTYTLTARCGATTQVRTVTINVVGNFAGHWIHNFGTMDITQNGASVTGTYHNAFDGGNGTVAGTVSGNTLTGTYQKSSSGTIEFTLNAAGTTFDGSWTASGFGTNKWCGAKSGVNFPSGCSFAGAWTNNVAGNSNCAMNLTRKDTTVTGTYCNGSVTGTVSYSASETILTGTWTSGGTGNFTFYLLGYAATQFQGNWSSVNNWCGWRGGAAQPAPCLR